MIFSALVILDKFVGKLVKKFLSLLTGLAVVNVLFSLWICAEYNDVVVFAGIVFSKYFCVCISVLCSMQ